LCTFVATEVEPNSESVNSDTTAKKMRCHMCRRKFRTALGLRMHKRVVHRMSKAAAKKFPPDGNAVVRCDDGAVWSQATGKKTFICSACGRQYHLRQRLVAHMVTHTGERPYACRAPGCTKRFGQSSTRNFHERSHSDLRPFLCTQCGKSFKQLPYLKNHIRMMHGAEQQRQACPVCEKEFHTQKALRLHKWNRHPDERKLMCDQCSKRFKSRQLLLRHQKSVHLLERPHECNICWKAFSQSSHLNVHMRTHTGEKPYLCSVCGQSFRNSAACKNHLVTHFQSSVVFSAS